MLSSVCTAWPNRPMGGRVRVRHAWLPCFNFPPFENIRFDKDKEEGVTTANRNRKAEIEKEKSEMKTEGWNMLRKKDKKRESKREHEKAE